MQQAGKGKAADTGEQAQQCKSKGKDRRDETVFSSYAASHSSRGSMHRAGHIEYIGREKK